MVILHAQAPIQPEARERRLAILDAVTPPSRAEDACQSYVIYEAVETPSTFIFVEEWASLRWFLRSFPHAAFHRVLRRARRGTRRVAGRVDLRGVFDANAR